MLEMLSRADASNRVADESFLEQRRYCGFLFFRLVTDALACVLGGDCRDSSLT